MSPRQDESGVRTTGPALSPLNPLWSQRAGAILRWARAPLQLASGESPVVKTRGCREQNPLGFYSDRELSWAGANLEAKKCFGTCTADAAAAEVRSGCDVSSGLLCPFEDLSLLSGKNPSLFHICNNNSFLILLDSLA